MNKDQTMLLLFLPVIFVAKCVGAIGTIVREFPTELKVSYKYLGDRK